MRFFVVISIFLLYEFLIYNFYRNLKWLSGGRVGRKTFYLLFLGANAVCVPALVFFQLWAFDLFTALAVLLWFWFLCGLGVGLLWLLCRSQRSALWLRALLPLSWLGLTAFGLFNALSPTVQRYEIQLPKRFTPFRLMLVADSHLGEFIGNRQLAKLRALVAAEKPDVLFYAGDIINDEPHLYLRDQMDATLRQITAPGGQFGVLGNHEYYGQRFGSTLRDNEDAIRQGGIDLLRDESRSVGDWFIIGRDDFTNGGRLPLSHWAEALRSQTDKVVILMDHQPKEINETAALPVDISLSGHTHRGQIFPLNFITQRLYVLDHGHREINGSHFFVTSGFGLWGVPLRLGSRAEVVVIDVKPQH